MAKSTTSTAAMKTKAASRSAAVAPPVKRTPSKKRSSPVATLTSSSSPIPTRPSQRRRTSTLSPPIVLMPSAPSTSTKPLTRTIALATPSPSNLAPSPELAPTTPSARRTGRLNAFAGRRSSSCMVAAEVQGLGRIAVARERLVDFVGSPTAQQLMVAAQFPPAAMPFGHSTGSMEAPAFDAFAASSTSTLHREMNLEPPVEDDRLGLLRSWLDSADGTDDESGEAWSAIPNAWHADNMSFEEDPIVVPSSEYVDMDEEDEDETVEAREEIRVSGKSIRVLVRTKRRLEADNEEGEHGARASKRGSPVTGAKTHCICHRSDEDEPMVQCDDCRIWYHLACLKISSSRKLGKTWFCFACTGAPDPSGRPSSSSPPAVAQPAKRLKVEIPSTPKSRSEPTLVPSAPSPHTNGSFYGAMDVVLAPSPMAPAIQHYAPRSPVSAPAHRPSNMNQLPADYAPISPLMHRQPRSRMISGAFDDSHAAYHSEPGWETATPQPSYNYDEPPSQGAFNEELYSWQCSTPSRALNTSFGSWTEGAGLQTPKTGSRRSRIPSHSHLMSTPSQEYLASLQQSSAPHDDISSYQQNQHHHQRSPSHGYQHPSSPFHPQQFYATPSSSFGAKNGRTHTRQRSSLSGAALFPSSSPSYRHSTLDSNVHWATPLPSPTRPVSSSRGMSHLHCAADSFMMDPLPFQSPDSRRRSEPGLAKMPPSPVMARSQSGFVTGYEDGLANYIH